MYKVRLTHPPNQDRTDVPEVHQSQWIYSMGSRVQKFECGSGRNSKKKHISTAQSGLNQENAKQGAWDFGYWAF